MSLRIYLDDRAYDKALVRLLRQVGWEVVSPFDAGIAGQLDEVHLAYIVNLNEMSRNVLRLRFATLRTSGFRPRSC